MFIRNQTSSIFRKTGKEPLASDAGNMLHFLGYNPGVYHGDDYTVKRMIYHVRRRLTIRWRNDVKSAGADPLSAIALYDEADLNEKAVSG